MRRLVAVFVLSVAAMTQALAQHDDYPARTVRIVVPSSPGGPIDAIARILADGLRTVWTVPVVVENKPGAGTSTGAAFVAAAAPDGYTLLVNPDSIAVNPSLYPTISADPLKSFVPVVMLCSAAQVLIARPDLDARDLPSFVALAKAQDLKLASAGAGTISHLTEVLLEQRANFRATHIPFRGAAPAITAMLGGHVDAMWVMLAPAVPHLKSGKVRALAVASATRDPQLPDVPTTAESGLGEVLVTNWQALFAPAGTPKPIVERLAVVVREVLQQPAVRERMALSGFTPRGDSGEAVADQIRENLPKWAEVIRRAGIRAGE